MRNVGKLNAKNFWAWLLLLVAMTISACGAGSATAGSTGRYTDSQQNINHLYNSVIAFVRVNPETGSNRTYCTGFYVQRNLIATAAHCFERPVPDLPFLSVPGHAGDQFAFRTWAQYQSNNSHAGPTNTATILAIDEDKDVALLSTDTVSRDFLTINIRIPRVGSTVSAMGHPGGLPWMLSQGIVSQLDRNSSGQVEAILASPPVFFGSSGGPLVNNFGEVVGVTGAIMFRQAAFGVFYPIQTVVALQPNLLH